MDDSRKSALNHIAKMTGKAAETSKDEEMISVDSPVTINHAAKSGVAPVVLAGLLGASLPVAGLFIADYLKRDTKPVAPVVDTDTDTNTQYIVEAMEGE